MPHECIRISTASERASESVRRRAHVRDDDGILEVLLGDDDNDGDHKGDDNEDDSLLGIL